MAVAKVEQVTPAVVTPDPSKQEEEYAVIGSNLANQFVFANSAMSSKASVRPTSSSSVSSLPSPSIRAISSLIMPQPLRHTDGQLTIWSSRQGHFAMRDQTAMVLGIPVSKVKVIPMEIGGGFGGKTLIYLEPVAALLSRKTGSPVKLMMTRAEVFEGTGPTSGTCIRVKMGARMTAPHGRRGLPGL